MPHKYKIICYSIVFMCLLFVTFLPIKIFQYHNDKLSRLLFRQNVTINDTPLCADINFDGLQECLTLLDLEAALLAGQIKGTGSDIHLWQSPPSWQISQAAVTDLNRDHEPEITLLVWRPYQPLPIDRFLPLEQSHPDFQNAAGQSCQLIMIGWKEGHYKEIWAGSALAEPVSAFSAADLDGDGLQELITLDSRYKDGKTRAARSLSVWKWNGFGFTLLAQEPGAYHHLETAVTSDGKRVVVIY